MSERWAIVDARGGGPVRAWSVVAGLPLVARHARLLARLGWQRLAVVCDDAERARIEAALARHPASGPLAIELCAAPPPGGDAVTLDGRGVYARERLEAARPGEALAPDVPVHERSDRRRARLFLFAQIRKSVELDGILSYYVMRPFARLFTRALLDTPLTPNHVTLGALACGLAAAVLVGIGGAHNALLAGLLYWLGGVIDHVDGELARLRLSSSKLGEWLDSMTDETSTFTLLAGLGIGLARDGHGSGWAVLGVAGALIGALSVGRLYLELHRRGLPIDTAQFPWFFRQDTGAPRAAPTLLDRLFAVGSYVLRRDVNVTLTAALLIADLRQVATLAIAAGAAVGAGLTLTHFALARRAGD